MKSLQIYLICSLLCFQALAQARYDIVIDEIMADPSPSVSLPNNEWIELKNVSPFPVDLLGWRIGDRNGQSGPMTRFILQPDSFVIICATTHAAVMSNYGSVVGLPSFPSLDNDNDQLFLKSAGGMIVHAVHYTSSWYRNELKKEGGWSLEMIDTHNPCNGASNWRASTSISGATAGYLNATDAVNIDIEAPRLKRTYATDSITIVLVLDEPADSTIAANHLNYTLNEGRRIIAALPFPPLFIEIELKTDIPLQAGKLYHLTANALSDCAGNILSGAATVKAGLPQDPAPGDWIVNEILFNPRPNAFDYVEFYNNSDKILDASRLFIGNRGSNGLPASIKALADLPEYIFPGDYKVLTEDAANLGLNYLVRNPDDILITPSLPSLPDTEGTVIALNAQGEILDEIHYKDDWHFALLNNRQGVSLERIDPGAPSPNGANWCSAASTAGYGTPGYKNSQFIIPQIINAMIQPLPPVFSPDNDGYNDIATIQYKIISPGYTANISIYDAAGRLVRQLVRNATLGMQGYWNWDGLDDKLQRLPLGIYIIVAELFNLQGKMHSIKKTIVLARKLN